MAGVIPNGVKVGDPSVAILPDTATDGVIAAKTLVDQLAVASEAGVNAVRTHQPDVFDSIHLIEHPTEDYIPKPQYQLVQMMGDFAGLGTGVLGDPLFRELPMGRGRETPRLGQIYGGSYAQQYEAAVKAIQTHANPYDAFVAFTLTEKPGDVMWGASDAFQVNEALRTFERNYSLRQNTKEAAAWGARFPADLRGDLAFRRLALAESQYDDLFLGYYDFIAGQYDPAYPQAVQAASTLDNVWGVVRTQGVSFQYLTKLTGATASLGYWYMHVYRALQVFVPALAIYYEKQGQSSTSVYEWLIPNLENTPRFLAWVIAANTFVFFRFAGDQALRDALTDSQLHDIEAGFTLAKTLNDAELYFAALVGQQLQAQIDMLSAVQYVLKILQMPLKAIVKGIPDLASAIPWYVWLLGGVTVLGVGYAVFKVIIRK